MMILMYTLKLQSLILWFSLKFTSILLQNYPEEKEEYLMAEKRPKIIEKQLLSVCKPPHILPRRPQFHALITNFCVLNEHKVQR